MTQTVLTSRLAVAALSDGLTVQARSLATLLSLPVSEGNASDYDFVVALNPADEPPGYRLELRMCGKGAPGPVFAEFVAGAVGHRRRFGGGRRQPLARAAGLKSGVTADVLDATAGLGRDAFVLATLGCPVRLIERSPIIAALLQNGLQRAAADPEVAQIVARMTLVEGPAEHILRSLPTDQRPDVVYMDPMYPHRTKSALVKKEMRLFRAIVGEDEDAPALLSAALGCARRRIVVKRPRLAPAVEGPKPSMVIESKATRFDVYLI
jgi:16S rRNA (guanine1516-N2)-methyltransferase